MSNEKKKGRGLPKESQAVLYQGEVWEVTEPCNCGCWGFARIVKAKPNGFVSFPAIVASALKPLTPLAGDLLKLAVEKR